MRLKFCTTCQSEQPIEGGYKKPNSTRGWRCARCMARQSASQYQSIRNMVKLTAKEAP